MPEMDFQADRQAARFDPWLVGAMLTALILRLLRLGDAALWFDETFTVSWVRLPWGEMVRTLPLADNHLPLYYLFLKFWSSLVGFSPWALRLPSAIFSWAIVPLTAGIAWTIKGRTAARWAAWFAAISPYLLQHAQDARMYALVGTLAAANTLLLARFLTGRSQKIGFAFWLLNAALLATHYYGVIFIGAEILVLVALATTRWRTWAPAMAASSLLVLGPVLAAKYLTTSHAGESYDIGWVALPGLVWSLINGYTLMPSSAELHAHGSSAALVYVPVTVPVLVSLLVVGAAALRSASTSACLFLAAIIGVVVLGPFAVHLLFPVGIHPRYAMACVPALLVLLAVGSPETASQHARAAAAAVLVLVMVIASGLHLAEPGHGREDVDAAGKWLDANVTIEEEMLVTSIEMAVLTRFHWPNRQFKVYPAKRTVVKQENADQIAADTPFASPHRVIYIYGREWLSDPDGKLLAALKKRYRTCPGAEVRGIRVLCFLPHRR